MKMSLIDKIHLGDARDVVKLMKKLNELIEAFNAHIEDYKR